MTDTIDTSEYTEWTDEELADLGKRKQIPEDPVRYVILNETAQISKEKGHLMLVWEMAPLQDPDDVSTALDRYTTRNYLLLPKKNHKVPSHKPQDTTWKCIGHMRAIYGQEAFPYSPRFNRKTKEWEQNGESFEGGADAAAVEIDRIKRAGLDKVMEHFKNPGIAVGMTVVATTFYDESGYQKVKGIRNDLGDDETWADLSDF